MAGGNKKKKKVLTNSRGFMTTSHQSKKNIENQETTSTDASGVTTPEITSILVGEENTSSSEEPLDRKVHELSPQELEEHLETSDLQTFVDGHASKVKKDASRHVSRLRTERRVLRSQADFLSTKNWLPEELMLVILDLVASESDQEHRLREKEAVSVGDELLASVWNLRLILLELEISLAKVNEVIVYLLRHSSAEASLSDAFDWLALNCTSHELLEYDDVKKIVVIQPDDESSDVPQNRTENESVAFGSELESPSSQTAEDLNHSTESNDLDVSDVGSDTEPDELISAYLRTKTRLYEVNPGAEAVPKKKKNADAANISSTTANMGNIGEMKLRQKLRKIESDILFDRREAEKQWIEKRNMLAKYAAQRQKLDLPGSSVLETQKLPNLPTTPDSRSGGVEDHHSVDYDGQVSKDAENQEDGDMLGSMFATLDGIVEQDVEHDKQDTATGVKIRNFGRVTGMMPRRILEETCRSRDSRCKLVYKQVSQTTYACQHSVIIDWTKDQGTVEDAYMTAVAVKNKPHQLTVTMVRDAAPDAIQSESYVATAALFLIFSNSPKEEKSHLRLPPTYRDLWHEFAGLKRAHLDAADREIIKELRTMLEKHADVESDDAQDDEVVFNASSRRLNGVTNGSSTPSSRPHTPVHGGADMSQGLKDIWTRKASMPSYQRMLIPRMNLPVFHSKDLVLEAIVRNQVTIIVGDTGSGKSTQVPQFVLEHELGQGRACKIYCTQPRRISAISLAQRVSQELGESKGALGSSHSLVGYAIRLESQTGSHTRLVYATVGIVLRMLEAVDGLNEISHLILDEVHERNIDTDFLLIVLQSLMTKRPDLKIILMSATVDAQKFSKYLHGAPIITVPGRTFPVQALFLEDAIELTGHSNSDASEETEQEDDEPADLEDQVGQQRSLATYSVKTNTTLANYDEYRIDYGLILKLVEVVAYHESYQAFSQAILIFVPGIQEIRQLHAMLGSHTSLSKGWLIHALHSAFSSEDQQQAFEIPPPGIRKIVIATNIAETGITIPDITCVIDTGKHREMRFDERRQMSRLTQSFVARANAKQRRGRAGRVQEGICFHLFTKYRHDELMAEQQTPEMLRLSLQDLIMRVKICKLGNIEAALSSALDPPSSKNIRRAIDALIEVDALTEDENLTPLGIQLAKLPLDAQLGKLLLYGACFSCLDLCLTIAATLTSKSPFLSPLHAKKQADTVRLGFKRGDSDLLTLYNAYKAWRNVCNTRGTSEYQFCNKNFLSPQNLANIEDLKRQLLISVIDAGFLGLDGNAVAATLKAKQGYRQQRNFVSIPARYSAADDNDLVASSVIAWSFHPKLLKRDGKGWRSISNNASLALHPTSVNKASLPPEVKYLSFYSIMQSSSKFTNAQETTPVSDFALLLLAGDAVFHMYAGVIVIDGNRLRFKVRDWKTMIALKILRRKVKEAVERMMKHPGKELGERHRRWMEVVERIFDQRNA